MDMEHKSTWLSQPIMLHSSRAFTCEGFKTREQCEWYQHPWHFWYWADWVFALPTVAFFMCGIGIFIVSYVSQQLLSLPRSSTSQVYRRLTATVRYLAYRGFRIDALHWNSASVGILMLGAIGVIYFSCMTLVPQPYYWPGPDTVWGNSPPLGTRSGWMALACMPFVFATASKANWITFVTGVSHEKLQIFHRWVSYAFFIMALFHTFPFIVWHIRNHDMVEQFTISNYFTYWTGLVALIFQAWLTVASFSWFRNLGYEFFKAAHFLSVILFVILFLWHCGGTLTSWDYFIATAAVYVPSLIYSCLRTLFEHGIGQKAKLVVEDVDFIRITVPTKSHWVPGQHYFLRFPGFGLHALTSHPFTICSLPNTIPNEDSEMAFYVRLRGGLTQRLYRHAEERSDQPVRILVDGPYGGINRANFDNSDRLVIIAGGSGAGWSFPLVEQFIRTQLRSDGRVSIKTLRVILATRHPPTRDWYHDSLNELVSKYQSAFSSTRAPEIEVHVTSEEEQVACEPKALETKVNVEANDSTIALRELRIRPDLTQVIEHEVAGATQRQESLGIFVCGPETMQQEVRNAVAKSNLQLINMSRNGGCKGVYLHLEHFSWA